MVSVHSFYRAEMTYSEGRDDRVGGRDARAPHAADRRVGREAHHSTGSILTLELAHDACGSDADLNDGSEAQGEERSETHCEDYRVFSE